MSDGWERGKTHFRKGSSKTFPKVDLTKCGIVVEQHPLEPFLPANGRILFLGSFPPPRARWSMEFFYPNWINDFWRIQGLIHLGDAHHFEAKAGTCSKRVPDYGISTLEGNGSSVARGKAKANAVNPKRFDRSAIIDFCRSKGLAFYDTAAKVCRWKGNASDEFLEILEPADILGMLSKMPDCKTIVTTGSKAAEELLSILQQINGRNAGVSSEAGALSEPGIRGIGTTATAGSIPGINATVTDAGLPSAVPTIGSYVDVTIRCVRTDSFYTCKGSSSNHKANGTAIGNAWDASGTLTGNTDSTNGTVRTIRWWRMPSTSRAYPLPLQAKAEHYTKIF